MSSIENDIRWIGNIKPIGNIHRCNRFKENSQKLLENPQNNSELTFEKLNHVIKLKLKKKKVLEHCGIQPISSSLASLALIVYLKGLLKKFLFFM